MRTERISIRVTPEEKYLLRYLARSHSLSLTDLIVNSCYLVGRAYDITREQMTFDDLGA